MPSSDSKISKKFSFNADIRRLHADNRKCLINKICGNLRWICENLRSRNIFHGFYQGFTLIELLLVVVILAVIVAISLPRFRATFSDLQTKDFIQDLISIGTYARERAILEGKIYRINLDFSNHAYWLSFKNNPEDKDFTRLNDRIFRKYTMPSDLTTQTNIDHMDFYPDGRIDQVSVNITKDNKNYSLNSDESLGTISVQERQE